MLFAIGDYLDLASETSLLLKHQDTVMKEIEAIQNTLNILAEQESRLLLNVKNHLAEYVNMKARNIKFVYVAIVTVSILIVFFLVFPYFQTNSVDISINIATEFLGAILTFVIFDIFYRRLENRYREANKLYDEMTEVVVKHQDTVSIALNRIENETTKLTNLSQSSNQLRSNVETSIKSVRDLQDRIKTYISRNETSPDSD